MVAALHCGHPDVVVDTAVTAVAQFAGILLLTFITLRCGSVVVDMCEMVGQVLINSLIIAAGRPNLLSIIHHYHHIAIYTYTAYRSLSLLPLQ